MDEQKRDFDIPLSFLEPGVSYEATLYRDADDAHYETNPQAYVIEKISVSADDSLKVIAAPGGGFGSPGQKVG